MSDYPFLSWEYVFLFLVFLIASQFLTGLFTGLWYRRIRIAAEKISGDHNNNIELTQEVKDLKTLGARKKQLGFLTRLVGAVEFSVFYFFTLLSVTNLPFLSHDAPQPASLLFGWLAIKTIGNYQQWAGAGFGRAMFYTFLLGTLINISFAVLGAYIVFR